MSDKKPAPAPAPENTAIIDDLDNMLAEVEQQEATQQAAAEQPNQQAAAEQIAAAEYAHQMGAKMAIGFCEQLLKLRYPYVTVDANTRASVEEKLLPVLAKHGGGLPVWLMPFKEELDLAIVLAGAGFGIAMQIRKHNQATNDVTQNTESKKNNIAEVGDTLNVTGAVDPFKQNSGGQ